jgi:CDP-diacylglycerol---glycerol-3-phosphate 3-phosphatidyltransferase
MQISVDRPEDRPLDRPLDRRDGAAHSVFWNVPNAISLSRIVACPVLLVYLVYNGPLASAVTGFAFLAISLTDLLDGYLARRDGTVTRAGKLLDPLADKLLVLTALILLVGSPGRIPWWGVPMVVAILGRELAITGLRAVASAEGVVIPAERLGKWKTGFQTAAITCLLVHEPMLGMSTVGAGMLLLAIATALALASGYTYVQTYLASRPSS